MNHPPLDGLRLMASPRSKIHAGRFYEAHLVGETLSCLSSYVGPSDDVTVEYDPGNIGDAISVRYWLKERGYKRVNVMRKPEASPWLYAEVGGES